MMNLFKVFNFADIYWYISYSVLLVYLFALNIILVDAELIVAIALLIMITLLYLKAADPLVENFNKEIYQIYQLIYYNILLFQLNSKMIVQLNNYFINLINNFKYYFFNLYYYNGNLKLKLFINPIKNLICQELNLLLNFEVKFLEIFFKSHLFFSLYNAKQYFKCTYLYKMFNDIYYIYNILYFSTTYIDNIFDMNEKLICSQKQFKQILLGFFFNKNFLLQLNYDK